MALYPNFPTSPYVPLNPEELVDQIRFEIHAPKTFETLAASFTDHKG
jgi:hypothetical protein